MKVTTRPYSQVYHKVGRRVAGAVGHPYVTPCGMFWYGSFYWEKNVVDLEDVPNKRPCMMCFKENYVTNKRTREHTGTSEYTTRELEWTY